MGEAAEEGRVVRMWIWERMGEYVDHLVSLLKDDEKALRVSALQILMSLQKHLSTLFSIPATGPQFHTAHFKKVVSGLLICPPPKRKGRSPEGNGQLASDVRDIFVESWFSVHDDVRWFFLREAVPVLSKHAAHSNVAVNLLSILEKLSTFPTEPSELNTWWVEEVGRDPPIPTDLDVKPKTRLHKLSTHQSLHSLASHRAVFTRAWLTLLPLLERDEELSVRVLNVMHRSVMPHLTRPLLVMDWVGTCVDFGGTVGLLALNTLFVLMTKYNLDYPWFYSRLYAFLDRDVLHLKHRARFFRMTEVFLGSTHLPATLLASFIKRLSRLSLNAPPSAIVMIIPFTYNILKRHPALMVMIHRVVNEDTEIDPFNMNEPNPNLTNALDSSIWELYSHKNHYHATVASLAKILEEAFTKPGYKMEDFLDHTYGTMLETEVRRMLGKEPAVAMESSQGLFGVERGSFVSDMWKFE